MAPGELVAFVPTSDLARAADFYVSVVGLELVEHSDALVVFQSGTTKLWAILVPELTPHPFTVLGWDVDDVDAAIGRLAQAGAVPLRYDGMGQDDAGVWTAPSGSRIAWFADPDGNVLSVQQHPH